MFIPPSKCLSNQYFYFFKFRMFHPPFCLSTWIKAPKENIIFGRKAQTLNNPALKTVPLEKTLTQKIVPRIKAQPRKVPK